MIVSTTQMFSSTSNEWKLLSAENTAVRVTVISMGTFLYECLCKSRGQSSDYYGNDGPIGVYTSELPVLDLWMEAARELGYDIGDPNGYQREGTTMI